jgi:ABC-type glutathione transport system ATPase component
MTDETHCSSVLSRLPVRSVSCSRLRPGVEILPGRNSPPGRRKPIKAVDGVTFSLDQGQTLGYLALGTGCGKSTTGRVISKLLEPTLVRDPLRRARHRRAQAFGDECNAVIRDLQDPFSAEPAAQIIIGTIVGAPSASRGG